MNKQQRFFKKAYNLGDQRIVAGYGWPMEVDPQQAEFLKTVKGTTPSGRALDIGCGQGRHTFLLADNGFDSYGIDFLERPINEAQTRSRSEGNKNVHFKVMDALHLDFPDNYFDVIIDWSVLDHIYPKDWQQYLQNVLRVLKKDGFMSLTEFSSLDKRIVDPQHNFRDEADYDHFFREDEIRDLFSKDFNILQIIQNELNTTSHFAMINILMQKK